LTLDQLIKVMMDHKSSDLHIRSKGPAYIRVDGDLVPVEGSAFTQDQIKQIGLEKMSDVAKRDLAQRNQCDFSFGIEGMGRFRVNYYRSMGDYSMALRYIPAGIPTLDQLRLPIDSMKKMCAAERGIILVTGITGSGKSSTLAAMIDEINSTSSSHIITVEDPVEFVHSNKRSVVTQREIGLDTVDFVDAIRGALRQDPDVILMGEMRDLETTSAAMTAAQTGHLVFGTLHTLDAKTTINRIIDLYPPHQQPQIRQQLAETLKGVVSQRLLRSTKGGRVAAVEVLIVTAHIKKLIEENHVGDIADAMKKGSFYGMQTFNQALVKLCRDGLATQEEVLAAATNPDDVALALRGIESESKS
jgi:twitching motility protein PilT